MKRSVSGTMLMLLLMAMLSLSFNFKSTKAEWTGTVYIRADGSIDPPDAPITTDDNVTYTLTGNIKSTADGIVVERDNIIIVGAGYTLQGTSRSKGKGIVISGRYNVTIKNINIQNFAFGIELFESSNSNITGNNIANNGVGIELGFLNNSITGNSIANNDRGVVLSYSSNNSIVRNSIANNDYGILLWKSSNNIIAENIIANNNYGVYLSQSSYNSMVGNDITTNNNYGIGFQESSNNSIVENTITGNEYEGIYLSSSSNNIIAGNNITANNHYGILLVRASSYNSMVGNNIANNWYGIYLSDSSYNSISGNNITANNNYGVYLSQSSNNIITGNSFVNDGLFVKSSYGNVVVDNLVNGKPLIYLEGISGYTIKNAGQVILIKCSYILVENLNLSNTDVGIELWITENIIIVRNNISANNFEGIYLSQSSNNIITGSTIANNLFGIFLSDASNNIIAENTIANNFEGISLQESSNNNSIVENTITGNTNGITLYDSPKYNSIIRNNITNNVANGISLGEHSDNNLIIGNSIMYNYVGIHLYYSSCNNKIIGNIITGIGLYSWNAIDLDSSSNDNLITENNFTNHEYTIRLYSSNNRIYNNNFIHCRTSHVVGPGYTNNWDDGYPSGGNYWSDYAGVDEHSGPYQNITGGDGIGDTPYVIDANNIDRYPLMQPVTILTYYLTISATLDGTTIPSPGIHIYVNGTSLNVKAIPNIGYSLDYWLLDGNMRTENPITIIMNANHTLEAYFIDDIPPEMSDPWQDPPANNVQPFQDVTVWVNVTDYGTGIKNVTLWYSIDNGLEWTILNMTEISEDTYQAIIRGYGNCTWVTYKIVAYDNAGNNATKDNNGYGYQYHVIPEYPLALILVMLMLTTLIATIPLKKRRTKNNFLNSEGLI